MTDPAGDIERRLGVACAAARDGGVQVARRYGETDHEMKAPGSPVTEADLAANAAVIATIQASFPGEPILSEESRDDRARLSHDAVWIVDPLDGTKEFLARNGEFAVMVGYARVGEAVLGAVYLPAVDMLYWGAPGYGAWVQRGQALAEPLVSAAANGSLRMVGSRSHHDPLLVRIQTALGVEDIEPAGSVGVKCARIAEARRDLYIHPVPYLSEWDTCAPEALVRGAGGSVVDCLGERLRYNKPEPKQPHGILACGAGVLGRVLDRVRSIYQESRITQTSGRRSQEG